MFITIVIIVVALPFVMLLANRIGNLFYNRSYTDVSNPVFSDNYTLVKVNVPPGEFSYNFSSRIDITGENRPMQEEDAEGYLCYDTVKKQLLVQTEEYVSPKVEGDSYDTRIHYVNIDMKGNVTADKNGLYLRDTTAYDHCVLLKNRVKTFHHWKDKKEEVSLRHFSMDDFNSHCLNPLRGIGNPTGGSNCYFWAGKGYYNIRMNGEDLKVKIPCRRGSMLFPDEYDYDTGLSFYHLPAGAQQPDVAFLVYTSRFSPHALYIIKRKS